MRDAVLADGVENRLRLDAAQAIVAEIVARYTIRATDSTLISVVNTGIRRGSPEVLARLARGEPVEPAEYYFRTTPVFETASDKYRFLNRIICVATGVR